MNMKHIGVITEEAHLRVQIAGRNDGGVPTDWCVVDTDGIPVPEAVHYLRHLSNVEASPFTRRSYAYDLAAYLTYLDDRGLTLDDVSNDLLGRFARHLRAPSDQVVALSDTHAARSRSTVNRALTTVASFYAYLGAGGPGHAGYAGHERLKASASIFRRADVGLLDNVGNARRHREGQRLGPRLPSRPAPLKILTVQQVQTILEACRTYQYRLFFTLAFTTGMRMGQLLGLRHEDFDTRGRVVRIVPRSDNENGVRAKTRKIHALPITREVSRLYTTYMHEEYGFLDSDYVFVSLSGKHLGRALRPSTIYGAVESVRSQTGIYGWSPHTLRHTYVTLQRQAGVPIEIISHLVTHANIHTTIETYSHMSVEDLRAALVRVGAWEEEL